MTKETQVAILVAGVGVGVVAGLLIARCSGEQLRQGIKQRASDAKDYLKGNAQALSDQSKAVAGKVKGAVDTAVQATNEGLGKVKGAMDTAVQATGEGLEKSGITLQKAGRAVQES